MFQRLEELGVLGLLLYERAPGQEVLGALRAAEQAYSRMGVRFRRPPRRRVTLLAAMAHGATRTQAEHWLRHLRFGREYGEPTIAVAEKAPAVLRTLRDRRKMVDSRLYHALVGLPDETVIYTWALGDERVRGRVERFVDELSRIQMEVSGQDLKEMGIQPGPAYSAILARALDDRLDGRAVGRDAELANLRRLAIRAGLT
jgi:tRNA nucleotidyltransferase (CCA-adding enzyme)